MCYDQPDFRSYKGIESRGIIKKKEESLEERVQRKTFECCDRAARRVCGRPAGMGLERDRKSVEADMSSGHKFVYYTSTSASYSSITVPVSY